MDIRKIFGSHTAQYVEALRRQGVTELQRYDTALLQFYADSERPFAECEAIYLSYCEEADPGQSLDDYLRYGPCELTEEELQAIVAITPEMEDWLDAHDFSY